MEGQEHCVIESAHGMGYRLLDPTEILFGSGVSLASDSTS